MRRFKRSIEKPKRRLDVFKYDVLKNGMGGAVVAAAMLLLLLLLMLMVMLMVFIGRAGSALHESRCELGVLERQ